MPAAHPQARGFPTRSKALFQAGNPLDRVPHGVPKCTLTTRSLRGAPCWVAVVQVLQPRVFPSMGQVETALGCSGCDPPQQGCTIHRGAQLGCPLCRVTMWVNRLTPDSPLAPLTSQKAWLGSLGTTAAPCSTGSDNTSEGGAARPGGTQCVPPGHPPVHRGLRGSHVGCLMPPRLAASLVGVMGCHHSARQHPQWPLTPQPGQREPVGAPWCAHPKDGI